MSFPRWESLALILVSLVLASFWMWSMLNESSNKVPQGPDLFTLFQKKPGCGGPCSYEFSSKAPGKLWPLLRKDFNCPDIMMSLLKYEPAKEWPPPQTPPAHLKTDFELNGQCPVVEKMFFAQRYSGTPRLLQWTPALVQGMIDKRNRGAVIGNYGKGADDQVYKAMQHFKSDIEGKIGLVIGSETPWVEVLALMSGAKEVTTLEYSKIHSEDPRLRPVLPTEFALENLLGHGRKFDFVFTYSSVEHSGLGRYGDALDPFGDLQSMAQAHCAMKTGSLLCVAVMVLDQKFEKCGIAWNAHRYYGKERLQHLTANFEIVEVFYESQPLICMRKI